MLPLYLDEDCMDRELVTALRARGVDVFTAADAGMIQRSDPDHLEYATSQGRVLHTSRLMQANHLLALILGRVL